MTPDDVVDVLSKCAAYDQRTVGSVDVMAWHEILARTELPDALDAVRMHYADSPNRAMPADIRKLALGIRDARQARERQAEGRLAIEAGTRDRSADVAALVRTVAKALPQPDTHARAVARARADRGRPERLPAQPKRPAKKTELPNPVTADIAAMATRYLLDGHTPAAVSEQLGVSRGWCERTAARLRPEREDRP